MMKNLILLFTLIIGAGTFAQQVAKNALLDIEQHAYQKKFTKKWAKTKQQTWEASVEGAASIDELNKLFNEFSDLFAQSTSFSMGNSDATSEIEFVEYMMKVEGILGDDMVQDWSADQRKSWQGDMQEFLVKEEEKKKKADQMARFQKMTSVVKSFDSKFDEIWEDSKKNAFANVTGVKISGASESTLEKDTYEVASLTFVFETDGDEQLAKKLEEELIVIILDHTGEGYGRGNVMNPKYVANMKKEFQFEGEKFAETAKKPTISIGVMKDDFSIHVVFTEPVFGH